MEADLKYCTHDGEYSWNEYDARGIPLCKVCDKCKTAKLSVYRPEVLTDAQYDLMGETLEEDV